MADKAWKAFERRLARDVGTERLPVGGRRAEPDFVADGVFYQAKLTKAVPKWIATALDGVRGYAARAGAVGVVVTKRPGELDAEAVVLLRWSDWVALTEGRQTNKGRVAQLGGENDAPGTLDPNRKEAECQGRF